MAPPTVADLIAHQQGRPAEAVDLLRRATRARPGEAVYWFNLGTVLSANGSDEPAVAAFGTALRLNPAYVAAAENLAVSLDRLNRPAEAAAAWVERARLTPADADAQRRAGVALHRIGQWGPAAAAFRRALDLRPDDAEAARELAAALNGLRQPDAAVALLRGLASPGALDAGHHGNLLLAMLYAGSPAVEVRAEADRWAAAHAADVPPRPAVHVGHRRPRLGYVSADLGDHPVGHLVAPLLAGHHRDRFEVTCYSNGSKPDAVTARLRASAEHWRDVNGLTDAALAGQIRGDEIDLLVDLSGHTAHNRLLTFARRPAAVQATSLGYPATTGLAAIDYRITDAWADPPGETEPFHTERLVRLPRCFLCLAPPADAPPIWPRPAGPVTFGSFNAAAKIGPATVRLWSAVLAAVPGSRLALKALGLMDPATRRQLVTELAVDPARVEFLPVEPTAAGHLARYGRVDIALDTYPYHGTMTTLDALWMGVPTVTLAGPAHVSRVGASLMHNAGLGEFVAGTPDAFVAVAQRWAADGDGLRQLRATMRDRLRASPLMGAATYVTDVEAAYDAMLAGTPI